MLNFLTLIPRPPTSGSSIWVCDIFQSAPRHSPAQDSQTAWDPQSKCTLLAYETPFRTCSLGPSLQPHLCHSPFVLGAESSWTTCVSLKHARHVSHLDLFTYQCLLFLWLLKPLCILKLTSSLKSSLVMLSTRVSFCLEAPTAHYSVPTLTPSCCSISTCLSPRRKASDRGPGSYLF